MVTPEDITVVIIAGGRGSRMGGQDKGLLELDGKPFIAHLLDSIKPQAKQIVINANRHQNEYRRYGYPVIGDTLDDDLGEFQGPLAGILTAMQQVTTSHILTLPCDAPSIADTYLPRMLDALNNPAESVQADVAIAHDGTRLQPLHALLPVHLRDSLHNYLTAGERKVGYWYTQQRAVVVDFADHAAMFENINTPAQYAALRTSREQISGTTP